MYCLDFKKEFMFLEGQKLDNEKPEMLNEILSFIMARAENVTNPLKLWAWAQKLVSDGVLEIDKPDKDFLKDFILTHKTLFVSAKGQMIDIIDSAKED